MRTITAFSSETMLPSAAERARLLSRKDNEVRREDGKGRFFADFSLAPAVGSQ